MEFIRVRFRSWGRRIREVPGPRAAKDWRMQTDGSSAPPDDCRLRLAWDGDDEGDEAPGAGRSPRKPAERAAAPQGRSADDLSSVEVLECSLREAIDELTAGRQERSARREALRTA